MFEVGRLVARIALEGAQTFTRDVRAVGQEFTGLSSKGEAAAREVGAAWTGIGASILGLVALMGRAAVKWETDWAGVLKTVDGTNEELATLQAGLRDLTAVLPASHTEIAAVAEAAGQLGIATENVVSFTRTMIDLGETTNMTSEMAATSIARFTNIMGTSQTAVSNLGSALVGLGNNYATTESEIMEMGMRLAGAGRQIGLTEGQTLGLAAALSSVGIEAAAGGSSISKVMIDIAASVDKGGERLEAFAQVSGMSADDFARKWRTAPGEALAAFVSGLANAESQGQSTLGVLADLEINEVRMRDALLRSAAASDMFADAMADGNDEFEKNNALADEAAKRYETVEAKVGIARNAVNDMAISFGESLLPMIQAAAEAVTDFARFMGELPPELHQTIVTLGIAAGVMLLFGGTALLAVPKVVAFRAAVATLTAEMPMLAARLAAARSFLLGPWGIGIAIAAVSIGVLTEAMKRGRASVDELSHALRNSASADDLFDINMKGRQEWYTTLGSMSDSLDDLDAVLEGSAERWEKWWLRLGTTKHHATTQALSDIGEQLSDLATTDLPAAQEAFNLMSEETDGTDRRLWQLLSTMPAFRDELERQALQLGHNTDEMTEAERKTTLLNLAQGRAEFAAAKHTGGLIAQADAAEAARRSITELAAALNQSNSVGQAAETANLRYADALAEAAEHLANVEQGAEGYGRGLDIATAAGRRNRESLLDLATAGWDAAWAQYELDNNIETLESTLTDARQAIIDQAVAYGATEEAARKYADQILQIPTEHDFKATADTTAATTTIQRFIDTFSNVQIPLRPVVHAQAAQWMTPQARANMLTQADGGVVRYFADGGRTGREHHVAQIARAGVTRVWAEPETGGELYAPLAPHKRSRSMAIIGQQLDEWGYDVVPRGSERFADGGLHGAAPAAVVGRAPANLNITLVNPVSKDPADDVREAGQILIAGMYV